MTSSVSPSDALQAEVVNIEMAVVERLRSNRVRIPSYPAVVMKLQQALDDPRAGGQTMVDLVGSDATLSAAVLRQANSVAFRGEVPLSTLDAAIVRVGSRTVIELAIATTIGKSAMSLGPLSALRRDVWRTALVSARLCQILAPRRGISPSQAFLAGLLHDFGAVVLVATLEDVANARRLTALPEHAWRDIVSRLHVEFGMIVAERWQLPSPIIDVMTRHHDPDVIGGEGLVSLVAMADQIVATLDGGLAMVSEHVEIPGLQPEERTQIELSLVQIGRHLASMEETMPSASAAVTAPTLIESRPIGDGGWPLELALTVRNELAQVATIWPDRFLFHAECALQPNWVVPIVLHCQPEQLDMLVNIQSCDLSSRGGFVVVAQPYALAGPVMSTWRSLVDTARNQAVKVQPTMLEVRFA